MVTKYQVKDALKTNKQKVEAELEHIQTFIAQPGLVISEETLNFIKDEINTMKDYSKALENLILDITTSDFKKSGKSTVTVRYQNESGNDIAQAEVHTNYIGKVYAFEANAIFGYTLKTNAANKAGRYSKDPIVVKFIYSKDPIKVTNVDLTPETATVKVGETTQLIAKVLPNNADHKEVTFKSLDEALATVDSTGHVTGVAEGEVYISVTTNDGGFTKLAKITVQAAQAE